MEHSQIALANGSVTVTADLVRALVGEGDEVVYAWRSFEAYPLLVGSHGAMPVPVPLSSTGEHDLEAMASAITDRTRLVLLCTPNNPTGPSLSTEQVEDFLAQVPDHVVVAIDEAYREFHDPATVLGTAGIFRRHGNVVLLRTFSKLQGLAGLRLGYAVAHPRSAQALGQVAIPFGASRPAQVAALASLRPEAQEELDSPRRMGPFDDVPGCARTRPPRAGSCPTARATSSTSRWASRPPSSPSSPTPAAWCCGPTASRACAPPSPSRRRTTCLIEIAGAWRER